MLHIKDILQYTKQLSILFVEDDQYIREQTQEILEDMFKVVNIAENGEEALSIYKDYFSNNNSSYDIVLSDICMPKMDGTELTEKIYDLNPSQVIMILSAHNDSEYLIKLINLGVEQFIQKPIHSDKLILNILEASKKVIQDNKPQTANISMSEGFIYNKKSKTISCKGDCIDLTKFEIVFVELLTSSQGQVYSNDDIVNHYKSLKLSIDPTNIRKLVSKLRKKLPEDSLCSIYGVGYKINQSA